MMLSNAIIRQISRGRSRLLFNQRRSESTKLSSRNSVKDVLREESAFCVDDKVNVCGWVKNLRNHKKVSFLKINDGSCANNLQIVIPESLAAHEATFGSCVRVSGTLVRSPGANQSLELLADDVEVIGACDPMQYPFKAKKHHPPDYLREFLHLRPRTNLFGNLLRVRNAASQGIHKYFQDNDFCEIHTPIITSNDCEGAGEIFMLEPADETKQFMTGSDSDSESDLYFKNPAFLTVSGQLHLEVITGAFGKVYNFSPTFRADNSRGRHHLSEFSMVEAELAFVTNTSDLSEVVENLLKSSAQFVIDKCPEEFEWFSKQVAPSNHSEVIDNFLNQDFITVSYTKVVEILAAQNQLFETKVSWGDDLSKEHEKFIVEHCGNIPVFVTDYPGDIKPFYMRPNEDGKTVAALDLLLPGVGEVCGGSLREERYRELYDKLDALGLTQSFKWYLDLRKYGSAPHGGFGVGFERFIQFLLGIPNIKDTLPFPRSIRNCKM